MVFLRMSFSNTAALLLFLLPCFMAGCRQQGRPIRDPEKMIVLQVIGSFDHPHLNYLQQEVQTFFQRKVVILPSIAMPSGLRNMEKGERYMSVMS